MSSIPIPDPQRAAVLRRVYRDNPVIQRACDALADFRVDSVIGAATVLPIWQHYRELSDREVEAVLAMFVDPPKVFPWDEASDRTLALDAELDPADDSLDARQIRGAAESVRDHRDAHPAGGDR